MSFSFHLIGSFLRYWIRAKGSRSLHSPFLFDLYKNIIKQSNTSLISEIEKTRKGLFANDTPIDVIDFKTKRTRLKTIGDIARTSLSQPRFSNLLRLLSNQLGIKTVLETGTSLGINALYLSQGESVRQVISIEGSDIIYQLAKKTTTSSKKILLKNGNIYDLFETSLVQHQPELVFLDADHRESAIDFCMNKINEHCPNVKCVVLHDIYWSQGMTHAWTEIINNKNYNLTIDLFQAGIIFPNQQMEKQHFTLRF